MGGGEAGGWSYFREIQQGVILTFQPFCNAKKHSVYVLHDMKYWLLCKA